MTALTTFLIIFSWLSLAAAAALYVKRKSWFWMPATAGVLAGQVVIIQYWEQTKFITFVTVGLLLTVGLLASAMRFRRVALDQADALFSVTTKKKTVTAEMMSPLPQPVQRWMHRADVVGKATPNKLIIHQQGTLRTKPESKWVPFEATQYFTIDPPGFVWIAAIKMFPLMEIGGRDTFRAGHGNMTIRPLYLFNAANARGKEIDQGTLVRYLAEMAWFPQAATSPYLRWQSMNESQAFVTMEYEGVSASGVYFFNADGDVTGFEAKRYGDFDGVYRKERWSVITTSFASIGGTRIGNKSQVTWKLPEGDFHWLNMEITGIEPAD